MIGPASFPDTLRQTFFAECEELIEAVNDGLMEIEAGTQDGEVINVLFRAVHSIKGGAGAFGLDTLVRFAHRFETFLDGFRQSGSAPEGSALAICFRAADLLADLVQASREDGDLPEARLAECIAELDEAIGDGGETGDCPADTDLEFVPLALDIDLDAPPTLGDLDAPEFAALPPLPDATNTGTLFRFFITFHPTVELLKAGHEPARILRALQELGIAQVKCLHTDVLPLDQLAPETPLLHWTIDLRTEAEQAEVEAVFAFVQGLCRYEITEAETFVKSTPEVAPEKPVAQADPAEPPRPRPPSAQRAIRVDLDRVERLVNLVGELVINQAMLSQSLAQSGLPPNAAAMNGVEEFHRLTRDIQDSVMMIRAQPVKGLFQRMSRVVREASAQAGKQVRLITSGETTEVDKTVIEALVDPLTHMIRNAVDHGVEHPADRLKAGKPEIGQLHLSAAHRSGRVIIDLSDDGAGINRPLVLEKAIARGLVGPDDHLSDSEIDALLFKPGFSTASALTDLSGRGVGMDVVMTAVEDLRGKITLRSEPGQGTRLLVSLPLTLAVMEGMVVRVADHSVVIPLSMVAEAMNLTAGNTFILQPGITAVRSHDGLVPLWDLGAMLGYRAPLVDFEDRIAMLITEEEQVHAALVVDAVADQRQVVIKGLDDPMCQAPGIAAATILGDGKVALILDPASLAPPLPTGKTPQTSASHAEVCL